MTVTSPVDAEARSRIRGDLTATLFVEAGAGTGKTAELVRRIVALVGEGVELPRIAAITFTEAAAAELRERIRLALEEAAANPDTDDVVRARHRSALDAIDEAPLSTLHSFAQRILAAHPVAAGLPPGFELVDANEMVTRFERRWVDFVRRLYHDPEPGLRSDLRLAVDLGLSSDHLRSVAEAFHQNWDLLDRAPEPTPPAGAIDSARLVAAIDHALGFTGSCAVSGDLLRPRLAELSPLRDAVVAAGQDERTLARTLVGWRCRSVTRVGRAAHWRGSIDAVRDAITAVGAARDEVLDVLRRRVLHRLLGEVARFTLEGAEERRVTGVLEFHDLLVRARSLLRQPGMRRIVQREFERILVDEFQDSDPLQVELGVLLAVPEDVEEAGPWWSAPRVEGRLFFVGDPKQSIYRFRRADIGLYARVRDRLGTDRVGLAQNWRSLPPVTEFVNAVFSPMFAHGGERQAPWADLQPGRHHPGGRTGTVAVLGGQTDARAEEVRAVEASELVRVVQAIDAQEWEVDDGAGGLRPARFDDVALLLPSRTALPAIEQAFTDARIPYRVESRSLVWSTQEVRDLLAILRAVDDPTDEVAVVAALRSGGMGCSDDDLVEWKRAGGSWRPDGAAPDGVAPGHPVAAAMADLAAFARRRHWVTPSELASEVVRGRRLLELAYARPRQRESWNRVRYVVEQARSWEAAGGATLRSFVDWAEAQADQDAQGLESVVPEPDDDAVRVLTIHASKGLEFPVVVLAGLSAGRNRSERAQVLWTADGRPEVRCGPAATGFTSAGYAEAKADDEELAAHEMARLLYVACTRARDHLVVSLHRPKRGGEATPAGRLAKFVAGVPVDASGIDELVARWRPPLRVVAGRPDDHLPEVVSASAVWATMALDEERQRLAIAASHRPGAIAATGVADLPDPARLGLVIPSVESSADEDDEGGPPARRPGSGTDFGIAVHAVLEHAPLDSDDPGLTAAAQEAASAAGVAHLADEVGAAARRALSTPTIRSLAPGRVWREVFVGAEIEGVVVEGFVDLVAETATGELVIVDWKTDAVSGRNALRAKADHYGLQLAAYAEILERTTGRPVASAVLVFCGGAEVHEVEIPDLGTRRAEVRDRLRALAGG